MLSPVELKALETKVISEFRDDYFCDTNSERVRAWFEYFANFRRKVLVALENNTDPEHAELLNHLLHAVDVAKELCSQQVTAFLTKELPRWLYEQIHAECPDNEPVIFFAGITRDLGIDGIHETDAGKQLMTVITLCNMRRAERGEGAYQFVGPVETVFTPFGDDEDEDADDVEEEDEAAEDEEVM